MCSRGPATRTLGEARPGDCGHEAETGERSVRPREHGEGHLCAGVVLSSVEMASAGSGGRVTVMTVGVAPAEALAAVETEGSCRR